MRRLERRHGRSEFRLDEIVQEVLSAGAQFSEGSIRTHITSRMCRDAPAHHGTVYADLVRVGRGLYKLNF